MAQVELYSLQKCRSACWGRLDLLLWICKTIGSGTTKIQASNNESSWNNTRYRKGQFVLRHLMSVDTKRIVLQAPYPFHLLDICVEILVFLCHVAFVGFAWNLYYFVDICVGFAWNFQLLKICSVLVICVDLFWLFLSSFQETKLENDRLRGQSSTSWNRKKKTKWLR